MIDLVYSEKCNDPDIKLHQVIDTIKDQVFTAICDSIDTSLVMENIQQLILHTNICINSAKRPIHRVLLTNITDYVTRLMKMFGLDYSLF